MNKEYTVDLRNNKDLQLFVYKITYQIQADVDAVYGRHCVDAKSVLGILSISSHPIIVRIITDDESEISKFENICIDFLVKGEK